MDLKTIIRRLGLVDLGRSVLLRLLHVQRFLIRIGVLSELSVRRSSLLLMGNAALAQGDHEIAMETYIAALARFPEDIMLREQIGVTAFLKGDYQDAERWFVSANQAKHFDRTRWGLNELPFRVLDRTWLQAIGHVTCLDMYVKAAKLGWMPEKTALLAYNPSAPPTGWLMFQYFSEFIRIIPESKSPGNAIDEILHGPNFSEITQSARDNIRAMQSQSFWYGRDGAGRTRWNAPFFAAVNAAWKASGQPAIAQPSANDRQLFRQTMHEVFGLPTDAWFVVIHVREPGFHGLWHKRHPGTRNANIATYEKVIDFVLAQGGWVIRGGDPTMKKIPPRSRVVDYATSPKRSAEIDIMICAECAYFVGTNSGFSLVPAIFGKRCALTNWSPIATPNWYLDDIYIPKIIRHRNGQRLTYNELFSTFAGWSQFMKDFRKTDLVIEDNIPDDLLLATEELHAEVFGTAQPPTEDDLARLRRFNEIAIANQGYVGSRMSYGWLRKYPELLD